MDFNNEDVGNSCKYNIIMCTHFFGNQVHYTSPSFWNNMWKVLISESVHTLTCGIEGFVRC